MSPDVTPESSSSAAQDKVIEEARQLTRARARDLRSLISTYVRRHLPEKTETVAAVHEPPRFVGGYAKLLPLLRLIPIVLLLGFGASFLWDFDGLVVSVFGYQLGLAGLLRIVTVSGLIGFLTNWLAITMLFNPRASRPIFGQGLIPAQRERVIYRLARAVSEELINEEIIKQKIEDSGVIPKYRDMALSVARGVIEDEHFRADLKALTVEYVNRVIASDEVRDKIVSFAVDKLEEQAGAGISGVALKVYRFLNEDDFRRRLDQAVREIPQSLDHLLDEFDHMLDQVPAKIEARAEEIERWATQVILGFVENLDVYEMVMENMSSYDERRLELLIKSSTNEQLNYIKYLGGILGCIGGLVIWKPMLALGALGATILLLLGVDELIMRMRGRRSESTAS